MKIKNTAQTVGDALIGAYIAYTLQKVMKVDVDYHSSHHEWLWMMKDINAKPQSKDKLLDMNSTNGSSSLTKKEQFCDAIGVSKKMPLQIPMVEVGVLKNPHPKEPYLLTTEIRGLTWEKTLKKDFGLRVIRLNRSMKPMDAAAWIRNSTYFLSRDMGYINYALLIGTRGGVLVDRLKKEDIAFLRSVSDVADTITCIGCEQMLDVCRGGCSSNNTDWIYGHVASTIRKGRVIIHNGDFGKETNGGAYNSDIMPFEDGYMMITRAEEFREDNRPIERMYGTSQPLFTVWDKDFKERSRIDVGLVGYGKGERWEDFRLFEHDGNTYSNYNLVTNSGILRVKPMIGGVDMGAKRFVKGVEPRLDFSTDFIEKNWVYFSQDGKLYMVYSFNPYVLLVSEDRKTFKTVEKADIDLGLEGYVSNSTNPKSMSRYKWLTFVHVRTRTGIYHHWAVVISKKTLLPTHISKKPVASGGNMKGLRSNVMYLSGFEIYGQRVKMIYGEGDLYTSYRTVELKDIQKDLRKL